ncbi:unnamed protein product [Brachionus calyciflorus]|uniref:Uncharacterized protein n=1 Tax=Brachionus calyciflorus TaxID=104777 RepID=A0A813MXI2_9BILA|nr:unnamed protein product [Brachionus calyciflorus]
MDLVKIYEDLFEKNEIPNSEDNWQIGELKDFSMESINKFGRAVIHNGKLYIAYSINPLIAFICSMTSSALVKNLNLVSKKEFTAGCKCQVNICNAFGVGFIHSKLPDKMIRTDSTKCRPIVLKCAFSNESLAILLKECVVLINEFTRNSYSMGFKIDYNPNRFKAYFFVFERAKEPNEEKIKILDSLIKENRSHMIINEYTNYELEYFEEYFHKNDMSYFGVKISFKKEINEENLNENIEFYLEKNKIDPDERGYAKIKLLKEDLIRIYKLWKKIWKQKI